MQLQNVAQNKQRFPNSASSTWQSVWQCEALSKVVENLRMMDEHNCINLIIQSQGQSRTITDMELNDVGMADSGITEHLWLSKRLRIPGGIWILQSSVNMFLDYKIQRKYLKNFHSRVVENYDMLEVWLCESFVFCFESQDFIYINIMSIY